MLFRSNLLQQVSELSNEMESIQKNGFKQEEVEDAINEHLRRLKVDNSTQLSSKWCDDFVDYVISDDRYIQSDSEMKQLADKIRATDSATLQQLLREWLSYKDQTLLVAYRNNAGKQNSLKKEEVVQAWDEGIKNPLKDFTYVRKDVKEERVVTPACLVESYPFKASEIGRAHV